MNFLKDHHGKHSLTRLVVAVCMAALIFWPLVMWTVVSISLKPMAMVDLPAGVVDFVKWAIGLVLAYAGHNKFQETRTPPPAPHA